MSIIAYSRAHEPRTYSFEAARDPHDPYEHCSYCGSLNVADAIKALRTPGTHYSGSDWKYGWPHKFYIDVPVPPHVYEAGSRSQGGKVVEIFRGTRAVIHRKFYNEHLRDASPEQFADFSILSKELFGITWSIGEDHKLYFFAIPGVQRFGLIGQEGESYGQCRVCYRRLPVSMLPKESILGHCDDCHGRYIGLQRQA